MDLSAVANLDICAGQLLTSVLLRDDQGRHDRLISEVPVHWWC